MVVFCRLYFEPLYMCQNWFLGEKIVIIAKKIIRPFLDQFLDPAAEKTFSGRFFFKKTKTKIDPLDIFSNGTKKETRGLIWGEVAYF